LLKRQSGGRADEVGRWTPLSLAAGVNKGLPFLLQRKWRSEMELRTVAAGRNRSFLVDENGALLACGKEEAEGTGLLDSQGGSSQTPFIYGGGADALAVHGGSSHAGCGLPH
jgi:hypothetical protein